MSNSTKIFLIGFMGSGKSSLGKKLANKLSLPFIDLDLFIEKNEGRSIAEIFTEEGEDYFRKVESECLRKATRNENFVMALGGGTPCYFDNIDFINNSGTSIYLKYNAGILGSRLLNAKIDRPLIKGKSEEELLEYINAELAKRSAYYLKSDFIVEGSNIKVEELLELIQ